MPAKADPLFTGPTIQDDGGSSDKVDLRPYSSTDLSVDFANGDLYLSLDGDAAIDVYIKNQQSSPIEYFQFADKVLTATQIESLA